MPHGKRNERARAKHREYLKRLSRSKKQFAREFVDAYKAAKGCLRCEERDPAVLDCHHRPGTQKLWNVSSMVRSGQRELVIEMELAKCDILCANCHRREHHRRRAMETPHEQLSLSGTT